MKNNENKTEFRPIGPVEIEKILGLTIKNDNDNKLTTLLCMVSAFTNSSQFNLSFNAPSSTGKSYIPLEIAKLFPQQDVIRIANCSPTAFFHDKGLQDPETGDTIVDLSRKIIIFTDQPSTQLLERLRPLLSHDEKEMRSKITDKIVQGGNRTKNVTIKGYPSVIFCSAELELNEQEATRFLLLSPELSQEKISHGINEKIRKETNGSTYQTELDNNADRQMLKRRLLAIKNENITDVVVNDAELVKTGFLNHRTVLRPRDQRDIARLYSLIKAITMLNLWFRKREGDVIFAESVDIIWGIRLWRKISESQSLNLPPYVYNLYKDVFIPAWQERNPGKVLGSTSPESSRGITRRDIQQKHYDIHESMINNWHLRQTLPMLEASGLIVQVRDKEDGRFTICYPIRRIDEINSAGSTAAPPEQPEDEEADEVFN